MGTDIINTIESLNTRNFSDYKILANDLRYTISKFDQTNTANLIADRSLDGYYFRINSIDFIKKLFNQKLEEFITNFFWENELIRNEIQKESDILDEINGRKFNYFYPLSSQTIEKFEYGPRSVDKMTVSIKHFERNYKSGYYTSPKIKLTNKNTSQKKSEGCFVATFAYDSYEHQNVMVLRKFRDEILCNSLSGKLFVKTYYKYSPSLVLFFEKIKFPKSPIKLLIKGLILIIPKQK